MLLRPFIKGFVWYLVGLRWISHCISMSDDISYLCLSCRVLKFNNWTVYILSVNLTY